MYLMRKKLLSNRVSAKFGDSITSSETSTRMNVKMSNESHFQ